MVIKGLYYTFYYDDWYPYIWDFLIKSWIYSAYVYNQDKCMNLYLYPQVQVKCTTRCYLDTKTYKYKVLIAGIDFPTFSNKKLSKMIFLEKNIFVHK